MAPSSSSGGGRLGDLAPRLLSGAALAAVAAGALFLGGWVSTALVMIAGVYYGAEYGGSIASILMMDGEDAFSWVRGDDLAAFLDEGADLMRSPRRVRCAAETAVVEVARRLAAGQTVRDLRDLRGGLTFLNLDRPWPDQPFTIVIWGVDRPGFGRPETELDGDAVSAIAGSRWEHVVDRAVNEGCAGIECLTGIPGSTGATPIQNVGAYGQEVSEVIDAVRVLRRSDLVFAELSAEDCGFCYRDSLFKREPERFVVTAVHLPHQV